MKLYHATICNYHQLLTDISSNPELAVKLSHERFAYHRRAHIATDYATHNRRNYFILDPMYFNEMPDTKTLASIFYMGLA
ncbi:hypothetical protein HDU86_006666 [Geranomyces michiganensis]|nr:hypothetical protein HDU86_006666 [Geranomyces michiganensis]